MTQINNGHCRRELPFVPKKQKVKKSIKMAVLLKSEKNPSNYKLPSLLIDFFDRIGRKGSQGFKAPAWQHFNVFITLICKQSVLVPGGLCLPVICIICIF